MKIVDSTKIINILDETEGRLVTAYQRPSSIKNPLDFLNDISELDYTADNIYDIMSASDKLFKLDALCGKTIDTMNDFATTNLHVEPTGSKKLDDIIEIFLENVNSGSGLEPGIYHLMQRMGLAFLVYGNALPLRSYKIIEVGGNSYSIPTRVTLLNPMNIRVERTDSQFGPKNLLYRVNDGMIKLLNKDARTDKNSKNIPTMIRRKYRRSLKSGFSNNFHITLNPDLVSHLKRKAMDFEDWGVPYLSRAFKAASIINKLQRLDESTLEGLINLITIFKIGSDTFPANQGRINAFAKLIAKAGATEPNRYLVWSHDVDILQVGPDGKILSFEERYRDAIALLRYALGLPDSLFGIKSSANDYSGFLGLLETLVSLRRSLSIWLEETIIQIADQNNIILKRRPKITWDRVNLMNDIETKNLILSFYDRGLIDPETAIRESGRDFNSIVNRKLELKQSGQDELFIHPKLPFSSDPSQQDPTNPNNNNKKTKPIVKKDKSIDFQSTAQGDNILYSAESSVYEQIFNQMNNVLIKKDITLDDLIGHIIGQSQRLIEVINGANEALYVYGKAKECRELVESQRNKFIQVLKSFPLLEGENSQLINSALEDFKNSIIDGMTAIRGKHA